MSFDPKNSISNQEQHETSEKKPGKGVLYFRDYASRKSPKEPDFKGFLVLEMDYKAGEKLKIAAWEKPTANGSSLLSLSEDNLSKKKLESESSTILEQPRIVLEPAIEQIKHTNNDAKIAIESGVEIPKTREIFDYPYNDMKVGDSFTVPSSARAKLLNANYRASKRTGFKFTARTEGDLLRTWRVE